MSPSCFLTLSLSFFPILGFLTRRNRKKDKKKKSSSAAASGKADEDGGESLKDIGSDGEDVRKSETPTPEVDEEGFSKRPGATGGRGAGSSDPWADFNQPTSNFYSSSDDSGDEDGKKKIKVEIKPVTNGGGTISASVDELKMVVGGGLELVPPPSAVSFDHQFFLNLVREN